MGGPIQGTAAGPG